MHAAFQHVTLRHQLPLGPHTARHAVGPRAPGQRRDATPLKDADVGIDPVRPAHDAIHRATTHASSPTNEPPRRSPVPAVDVVAMPAMPRLPRLDPI
ncbi:hypothetical protein QYE76_019068 [Lolium multiflorum]|uniref:Uncharacterized protein n=1 Tax=Lolium multiflorum TaxID=4521 RepID=A0AAD8VQ25_LOLMU|nr:hypothetical protein QYE76_019068 [Lolium multiflorum]